MNETKCPILSKQILETTLYYQAGPLAAVLYPATEERLWTFEKYSYYIHHVLLLLIPIYLHQVYSGKPQHQNINNNNDKIERIPQILRNPFDLSWFLHVYGVWLIGTIPIHWISFFTMANINVTLCPVDGVPGYGDNYRLHILWFLIFCFLMSAIFYTGMTRFTFYVTRMISEWNANRTTNMNANIHCHATNKKVEKEE